MIHIVNSKFWIQILKTQNFNLEFLIEIPKTKISI